MRFSKFIICILLGILLEFILRIVFVGYPIILVPELMIFLAVIDFNSQDLLVKFVLSAVAYDLLSSSQIGPVVLALLGMFFMLYFLGRISFFDSGSVRRKFSWPGIIAMIILSEFLFLVYYMLSFLIDKSFLIIHNPWQISWSWHLSFWSDFLPVCFMGAVVFLFLYLGYSFLMRPKRFKL